MSFVRFICLAEKLLKYFFKVFRFRRGRGLRPRPNPPYVSGRGAIPEPLPNKDKLITGGEGYMKQQWEPC